MQTSSQLLSSLFSRGKKFGGENKNMKNSKPPTHIIAVFIPSSLSSHCDRTRWETPHFCLPLSRLDTPLRAAQPLLETPARYRRMVLLLQCSAVPVHFHFLLLYTSLIALQLLFVALRKTLHVLSSNSHAPSSPLLVLHPRTRNQKMGRARNHRRCSRLRITSSLMWTLLTRSFSAPVIFSLYTTPI